MNLDPNKILDFIPTVILSLGGAGLLTTIFTFIEKRNQRNELTQTAIYQEFKKEFKKELEEERKKNQREREQYKREREREREQAKKERDKLFVKIDYLENDLETTKQRLLGLDFEVIALKQQFHDLPDAEKRIANATQMANNFKKQVGVMEIPVKENTRVEYGGWIALVVGLICLTFIVIFALIWFVPSKNVDMEEEIRNLKIENSLLREKQINSSLNSTPTN